MINILRSGLALFSLLACTAVQSATIEVPRFQFQIIPVSSAGPPVLLDYDLFDPEKGRLDSVDVNLSVSTIRTYNTAPNLLDGSGVNAPQEYSSGFVNNVRLQPVVNSFDISPNLMRSGVLTASGLGDQVIDPSFLNASFSLDAADPTGLPTPVMATGFGGGITFAQVDDFIARPTSVPFAFLAYEDSINVFDPRFTLASTLVTGTLQVTYNYTQFIEVSHPDDDEELPSPVPLPAGAWMLLSSLALLGVRRRRF